MKIKKKHFKLKIVLLVIAVIAVVFAGYNFISGYIKSLPALKYDYYTGKAAPVEYPDIKFAVISDIHMYDKSLGNSGTAFEEVLNSDRKLLLDSEDLLDYAIDDIIKSDVQVVLIPGDLTKDGELINHNIAADKLRRLTEAGKKVFVIPGNHDINNPGAFEYLGDTKTPVSSINAQDFTDIYADFGYKDAVMRDSDSLSYVADFTDDGNLWLLAIDSCRYRDNAPGEEEIPSGKISQETEQWIENVLKLSVEQNKAIIVMIHHGIVEHWKGQAKLHPDYLIKDYKHFGKLLSSYNVRIAFTGHYHAQDITKSGFKNSKYLYDVETGSLITPPCPVRYCEIKDGSISITTNTVADKIHPGTDFENKSLEFVKKTVVSEAYKTLKGYKVSDANAEYIADYVGEAFLAHYAGDEDITKRPVFDENKLSILGRFIYFMQKYVPDGLWHDLPPADNNVSFDLH